MNKKAVFFTIMSIIFLGVVYFSLQIQESQRFRERANVVSDRVESVDFFISDLERDIQRGAYIGMFRSLLGIQQYITSNGKFINNTEATFEEILLNGTIDGTYVSVMNQTEMSVWIAKIQSEASKIGVEFTYSINGVNLYHKNPWVMSIDLNVTMNITDSTGTATWLRDDIISSDLNITSFEDPVYAVYTFGRVINTVEKSNITDFTDGNDTTNLLYHLTNSRYVESTSAPSFIMRLSGNLSNSTFGIESLVNLKKLEDAALTTYDKTCVDYLYFSNMTPQSWFINNTYNWFKLDNQSNHLGFYEAENLTI